MAEQSYFSESMWDAMQRVGHAFWTQDRLQQVFGPNASPLAWEDIKDQVVDQVLNMLPEDEQKAAIEEQGLIEDIEDFLKGRGAQLAKQPQSYQQPEEGDFLTEVLQHRVSFHPITQLVKAGHQLDQYGQAEAASRIDDALLSLAQTPGGQVANAMTTATAIAQSANSLLAIIQQMRQQNLTAIPAESASLMEQHNQSLGYNVHQLAQLIRQQAVPATR